MSNLLPAIRSLLLLTAFAVDASAQPAPPAPAPVPPAAPALEPPPPKSVAVGKEGLFNPGLLLQGWMYGQIDDGKVTQTMFRLRRAELKISGDILPKKIKYLVMIDPAKALEPDKTTLGVKNQDPGPTDPAKSEQVDALQPPSGTSTSILQDAWVGFVTRAAEITLGQFKIPISWEGYNSSSKLLFPERAFIARQNGDKRDLGLRIDKKLDHFYYNVGVYNGPGLNRRDGNNQKDLATRVELYPIEGITIAGAALASVGQRDQVGTKDRAEGDLRLEKWNALFQAEYIYGNDVGSTGAVGSHGAYAAVAYAFFDRLQPALRVGFYDPDIDANVPATASGSYDELMHYEVGVNYYFQKHEAKLQASYSYFANEDKPKQQQIIVNAQVAF